MGGKLFSVCGWESLGVEGPLYALLHEGLEHPWILIPEGGPGTSAPQGMTGKSKAW